MPHFEAATLGGIEGGGFAVVSKGKGTPTVSGVFRCGRAHEGAVFDLVGQGTTVFEGPVWDGARSSWRRLNVAVSTTTLNSDPIEVRFSGTGGKL